MSLPTRVPGLGAELSVLRVPSRLSGAKGMAMREIEVRFATALVDASLPKSKASFGAGLSGSIAREHLVNRIAQAMSNSNALGIAKAVDGRDAVPLSQAIDDRQQDRRQA